jgi:hypothetical protein
MTVFRFPYISLLALLGLLPLIPVTHAAEPAAACSPGITGHWRGNWESGTRGHHGPIAARFTQLDECHYLVHFHGRFAKAIPFYYTATLTVSGYSDGKIVLTSSAQLPIFGTFQCTAWVDAKCFEARYSAADDEGVFRMYR